MITVIAVSLVFLAVPVLVTAAVLRRMDTAHRTLPVTAEWIDELSTDRYRPMIRLLDTRDIEFLRSQAGFTWKMERKLRAQRCQIFRGYLRCLDIDFQRVCTALKLVLLHSQQDRPDLSAALVHYQIAFAAGLVAARLRLLLYRLGIGSVDVTTLVGIFDLLRIELRTLVPVAAPVCA